MSVLFIANKSPFTSSQLLEISKLAQEGDGLILIQDGVLATYLQEGSKQELLRKFPGRVYGLKEDIKARAAKVDEYINVITYKGFASILSQYAKTY